MFLVIFDWPALIFPVFGQKRPGAPDPFYFYQLPSVFSHFMFPSGGLLQHISMDHKNNSQNSFAHVTLRSIKKLLTSYINTPTSIPQDNLQSDVYRDVASLVSIVSPARASPDDEVTKRDMSKRRALTLVLMTARGRRASLRRFLIRR